MSFILGVLGIILLLIIAVVVLLTIVFIAMVKGLFKKHPRAKQAEAFVYRLKETHFSRNKQGNSRIGKRMNDRW